MVAQEKQIAEERYELGSFLGTFVDGHSEHSLAETIVDLRIVPHPEALFSAPPPRTWLPTRIPDDYEGRRRIRTLYAPHNVSAPIRLVPKPVLTRIFTVHGVFRDWREVLALTHVCRAWRDVALATPQLWADAVWSLSRSQSTGIHAAQDQARFAEFLLLFLSRTCETHPIGVGTVHMARQRFVWEGVVPHLSKLSSLSVVAHAAEEIVDVLETLRAAGMPSLAVFELVGNRISHSPAFAQLAPWRDTDFPRLRELKTLCSVFSRAASVKSLRAVHLVAWSADPGYVDGLSRCVGTLESLTLEPWRKRRLFFETVESLGDRHVHLPNIRNVSVTGDEGHVQEVFAALAFPETVHVDLTFWDRAPALHHIYALLPTNLSGVHTPPLIDSLQFRLGSSTLRIVVRCLAGSVERLCVKRSVHSSAMLSGTILTFGNLPSVTELAVNLTSVSMFSAPRAMVDPVVRLIRALWDLQRLELLGAARRHAKFRILDGFLRHHGQPTAVNADSLIVAWAVQLEYGGVGAAVDELEQLIEVLAAHHVTSGARLARLELCVTADLDLDRYKSCYRVRDLCPDRVWSGRVARRFLGRLELLADEVVILGDWEKHAADIEEEDEWYRGGGAAVWKEAVAKGTCWEWGRGGEVVVTRSRIEGHICRSCQQADVDPNSSDDEEEPETEGA